MSRAQSTKVSEASLLNLRRKSGSDSTNSVCKYGKPKGHAGDAYVPKQHSQFRIIWETPLRIYWRDVACHAWLEDFMIEKFDVEYAYAAENSCSALQP